jgi:hypothetical protein
MRNRFLDRLILLLESLESGGARKRCLWVSVAGIVVNSAIWAIHINHPLLLLNSHRALSELVIVMVLAPPFLTVVSIAYFLFPGTNLSPKSSPGLLSTFLQRERNDKRWKIMITAGIVSVANLMLMILRSGG